LVGPRRSRTRTMVVEEFGHREEKVYQTGRPGFRRRAAFTCRPPSRGAFLPGKMRVPSRKSAVERILRAFSRDWRFRVPRSTSGPAKVHRAAFFSFSADSSGLDAKQASQRGVLRRGHQFHRTGTNLSDQTGCGALSAASMILPVSNSSRGRCFFRRYGGASGKPKHLPGKESLWRTSGYPNVAFGDRQGEITKWSRSPASPPRISPRR